MNRRGLLLILVVTLGAEWADVACVIADGGFAAHGLVVDGEGRPIADVMVKARNSSTVSDERGCFDTFEITYPHRHEMPFSVAASGFKPFAGTLGAPGRVRVRVILAEGASAGETVVDSEPEPGALGACEPQPREVGFDGGH